MEPRRQLRAYFALAFAIAWTGIALVAARTGLPARADAPASAKLLVFLAMLAGPSIAALGLTAAFAGRAGLRALRGRLDRWPHAPRWYAAIAFAPALLAAVLATLSLAAPRFAPGLFAGAASPGLFVAALVAGGGAGFFEELGWTGFATPRLLPHLGWLRAGAALGLVWGAWHALADYWGGASWGALWAPHMLEWIAALAAFRVLMTWVYTRTESLPLAMLLHAGSTGAQVLLWPVGVAPRGELVWYGLFALALWLAVAALARHERAAPIPMGNLLVRFP
jgi:membrane protease YdiL (CAAX protease family)